MDENYLIFSMKKLNVEANKSFYHGFVLNEQELRRFNDLLLDQLKKDDEGEIQQSFSVIFENGVVAVTDDIEEILTLENSGSAKIVELKITSTIIDKRQVLVEFINADSSNVSSEISIKYNISGTTRDWVFITSSLIEERIKKIKRWNVNFSTKNKKYRLFTTLSFPLILSFVMLFSLFTGASKRDELIAEIRQDYESEKLTDPIEAILRIQESGQSISPETPMMYVFVGFGILLVIMLIIYFYFLKLYPIYNFCWGDYLEIFEKRESSRKTVNTVVIIGLFISIIGGLVANYIGN